MVCVRAAALAWLTLWAFSGNAAGGPANPAPVELVQPNGASFLARLVGDEWANAYQTLDGYAVLRNDATGFWVYADKDAAGALVPTALVVTGDSPAALRRGLRPEPLASAAAVTADSSVGTAAAVGDRPLLILLVQFVDKAAITTPAAWQSQFFGTSNSVRHHYAVSSYGNATLLPAAEMHGAANDGIVGWLTLPSTHPNTGSAIDIRNQTLARDAILAADPFVDFSAFDVNGDNNLGTSELLVVVVAAGNETSFGSACSPSVWGHVWSIFFSAPTVDGKRVGSSGYGQFGELHCRTANPPGQIATIGIMAHEIGHLFGLPDLYDGDGSSEGVGVWSLMGGGSWNGTTRPGDSPSLMDPWSKARLAWMTPTRVVGTLSNHSIPASATSPSIFQFRAGNAVTGTGEYFLVENRQQTSYDTPLPGAGLLIWHIDEAVANNRSECIPGGEPACSTSVHYKVAVIQADSRFDLENGEDRGDSGDPYPGSTNNRAFTSSSAPGSQLWNGGESSVNITLISNSGTVMTATLAEALTSLFIDDVSVTEGHSGTLNAIFTVSLSATSEGPISVSYATADGSAVAASGDYVPISGTLPLPAGSTSGNIVVAVNGDATFELPETFMVQLSAPSGATIADGTGVALIRNDDLTDHPLVSGLLVAAVHLDELRAMINAVRALRGLATFTFTDPLTPQSSAIRAVHIAEMRSALPAACSPPSFTDPVLTPGVTTIKAAHVMEIRNAVLVCQ